MYKKAQMMKQLLIALIVFIVGAVVGGVMVAGLSGKSIQQTWQISEMQCRADFGNRVWQAYQEESSEVAIWALKNFIQTLNKQLKQAQEPAKDIQIDLVLAYVRLAILHKQVNDIKSYHENIAKALTLSNDIFPDKKYTEESLLTFVIRIDKGHK